MDLFAIARSKRSSNPSDEKDKKVITQLLSDSIARLSELDTVEVFTKADIKRTYKLKMKAVNCVVNVIAKVLILNTHLKQDSKDDIKKILEFKLTDPLIDVIEFQICELIGEFEDDDDYDVDEICDVLNMVFFEEDLMGTTAWKVIDNRLARGD
jgi:hypothetical protein